MAKSVYWRNGTYASTISVNKQEKEFSAFLEFRNGNIKGKCESVSCRFNLQGTYVTSRPFSVKMEFEDAFGIAHIDFVGNHASDNTIFGTWSTGGVPGGDVWFRYKQLSKEENEKLEKEMRDRQISELLHMGFDQSACERALRENKYDLDRAIDWLMNGNHLVDASDGSDEYPKMNAGGNGGGKKEPTEDQINQLVLMGFSKAIAQEALAISNCDVERAVEWLFNQG